MKFNFLNRQGQGQDQQGQGQQGQGQSEQRQGQGPLYRLRKVAERGIVSYVSQTAQQNKRVRSPVEKGFQHLIFTVNDAAGHPDDGVLASIHRFAASQGRGLSDIEQVVANMLRGAHYCFLQKVESERHPNSTNLLPCNEEVFAMSVRVSF